MIIELEVAFDVDLGHHAGQRVPGEISEWTKGHSLLRRFGSAQERVLVKALFDYAQAACTPLLTIDPQQDPVSAHLTCTTACARVLHHEDGGVLLVVGLERVVLQRPRGSCRARARAQLACIRGQQQVLQVVLDPVRLPLRVVHGHHSGTAFKAHATGDTVQAISACCDAIVQPGFKATLGDQRLDVRALQHPVIAEVTTQTDGACAHDPRRTGFVPAFQQGGGFLPCSATWGGGQAGELRLGAIEHNRGRIHPQARAAHLAQHCAALTTASTQGTCFVTRKLQQRLVDFDALRLDLTLDPCGCRLIAEVRAIQDAASQQATAERCIEPHATIAMHPEAFAGTFKQLGALPRDTHTTLSHHLVADGNFLIINDHHATIEAQVIGIEHHLLGIAAHHRMHCVLGGHDQGPLHAWVSERHHKHTTGEIERTLLRHDLGHDGSTGLQALRLRFDELCFCYRAIGRSAGVRFRAAGKFGLPTRRTTRSSA